MKWFCLFFLLRRSVFGWPGGGVKGGTAYGATHQFLCYAIEDPCDVDDLWATVLYQLGIDHERLTYRYAERGVRLTDVHGNVFHGILA